MNSKVVSLHPQPRPIGHFIHLGHAHRQLQNLLVSGSLPVRRAVVDAAHAAEQLELLIALKRQNVQLVLDTRAMELGTPGGSRASRLALPWARGEGHWTPEALTDTVLGEHCRHIATAAVAWGADVVLAPTHLLEADPELWLARDARACELLRVALDAAGGRDIGVDYPLYVPFSSLQSSVHMNVLRASLADAPFDNLWLRADGFGVHATAARTDHLVRAASELTQLERPVVLDHAAGYPALIAAAFGVVGAIAHGIANQAEQWKSYGLRKPSSQSGGGGGKWVYLAPVDRYIKANQLDELFALRGAKSHLICTDPQCCPQGANSMKVSEKRHAHRQRARQLESLSVVPELNRPEHLLRRDLQPAGHRCRQVERLPSVAQSKYVKFFSEQSRHLDDLAHLLDRLLPARAAFGRSPELVTRHAQTMPQASGFGS